MSSGSVSHTCDLCDVAPATHRCEECATSGLEYFCADDDAALHQDGKKKGHVRTTISNNSNENITTNRTPTTNTTTPATATTTASTATTSFLPGTPSATNSTTSSPIKPPTIPPSTLINGLEREPLTLMPRNNSLPMSTSITGNTSSNHAPILSSMKRPSLLMAQTSPIQRPSLLASPPHYMPTSSPKVPPVRMCHICDSEKATLYCDTCKRDGSITSSQYCNQCNDDFHKSKRMDFHFRQTMEAAEKRLNELQQLDQEIKLKEAEDEDPEDAALSAAIARRRKVAADAIKGTPEEQLAAVKIQSLYRGASTRRSLDMPRTTLASLTQKPANPSAAHVTRSSTSLTPATQATSMPVASVASTAIKLNPTATATPSTNLLKPKTDEELAAIKIQSMYRGASIRKSLDMPRATVATINKAPTTTATTKPNATSTTIPPPTSTASATPAQPPSSSTTITPTLASISKPIPSSTISSTTAQSKSEEELAALKIQSMYRGASVRKTSPLKMAPIKLPVKSTATTSSLAMNSSTPSIPTPTQVPSSTAASSTTTPSTSINETTITPSSAINSTKSSSPTVASLSSSLAPLPAILESNSNLSNSASTHPPQVTPNLIRANTGTSVGSTTPVNSNSTPSTPNPVASKDSNATATPTVPPVSLDGTVKAQPANSTTASRPGSAVTTTSPAPAAATATHHRSISGSGSTTAKRPISTVTVESANASFAASLPYKLPSTTSSTGTPPSTTPNQTPRPSVSHAHQPVTDHSLAMFMTKLDVLESRLRKESLALNQEKLSFENEKYQTQQRLLQESEAQKLRLAELDRVSAAERQAKEQELSSAIKRCQELEVMLKNREATFEKQMQEWEARSQQRDTTTIKQLQETSDRFQKGLDSSLEASKTKLLDELRTHIMAELQKQLDAEAARKRSDANQQKRLQRDLQLQQKAAERVALEMEREKMREEELQKLIGMAGLTDEQQRLLRARTAMLKQKEEKVSAMIAGVNQQHQPQPQSGHMNGALVPATPIVSPRSTELQPYHRPPSATPSNMPSPYVGQNYSYSQGGYPTGVGMSRWPVGGLGGSLSHTPIRNSWGEPTTYELQGNHYPATISPSHYSSHPLSSPLGTQPRSYFDTFLTATAMSHQMHQQLLQQPQFTPVSNSMNGHQSHRPRSASTSYDPSDSTHVHDMDELTFLVSPTGSPSPSTPLQLHPPSTAPLTTQPNHPSHHQSMHGSRAGGRTARQQSKYSREDNRIEQFN